ncbi:urease accessory protein UreE [Enteractinococcus helveticum]|uniref:Urease accessory protein UreE n=1 Tax=Enteractinococcus helveticum TaxID=1837282 RepID=A0A1B7M188_9MICC|nr:urease accessory protein UreE [Enteractinococcus helveticum]OAV62366.1 Urease accessory protein UreE [Enteractinococcus helveticum]
MIIHEIVGNRADLPAQQLAGLTEDRVVLDNEQLLKRVQRLTTTSGRELGLRLANNQELHDGDIVYLDDNTVITVQAAPADVLVIAPTELETMAFVAHSLGNRHLQAQFFGPESEYGKAVMVVRYDHTVEDFLTDHNIVFTREQRVMPKAFRHAEHSH